VAGGSPPDDVVRAQLARILASEVFARSDRLTAFLTYIVEQSLDGHGTAIKEHVLAMEVYGKGADFEAGVDPIVRVDARRLRDKLREYYASAPYDPVTISVPKGSYAPTFDVRPLVSPPAGRAAAGVDRRARLTRRFWVAGAVVVLVAAMAWLAIRNRTRSALPVRLLTVTSFPGSEGSPSFSPDGNFVAITWTGPDFTANGDVWVKAVEGDAFRRLTDTPDFNEVMPSWSPDGQQIAFVRYAERGNRGVYLISALGGSDRKISESGSHPAWLPDSQSLVFEDRVADTVALVHYVLATGERRPLTTPPAGFVDFAGHVSPDGKTLAFIRSTTGIRQPGVPGKAGLFVMPMPGGDPVRVDDRASGAGGPAWTPDSREILYPRWDAGGVKTFRVPAHGGGAPVPAAGLPITVYQVSTSGFRADGTFRVGVVDAQSDVGLRMIDLQPAESGGRMSAWTAFCDSTHIDWPGRFSRDGAQVSFTSDRNGLSQILAARRDGTHLRTVTAFDGVVGLASWSPDGRFLVFDGVDAQNRTDLFIVSADGGPLRRLTDDDQRESNPEWSRDGRWIYYAAAASGRPEIWKIPAAGGTPVQLTTRGGLDPRESPDGKSVYFRAPPTGPGGNPFAAPATLERMSVDGGRVSTVLSGVRQGRWDLTDAGILFLTGASGAPDPAQPDALEFFSFMDGRTRRVGEFPFPVTSGGYSPPRVLSASPDGRWVVVSHMDHWARDIVVADNFR
jgi:Tol biopolymer transport system component